MGRGREEWPGGARATPNPCPSRGTQAPPATGKALPPQRVLGEGGSAKHAPPRGGLHRHRRDGSRERRPPEPDPAKVHSHQTPATRQVTATVHRRRTLSDGEETVCGEKEKPSEALRPRAQHACACGVREAVARPSNGRGGVSSVKCWRRRRRRRERTCGVQAAPSGGGGGVLELTAGRQPGPPRQRQHSHSDGTSLAPHRASRLSRRGRACHDG